MSDFFTQLHLLRPLWLLALPLIAFIAWMKLVRGNPRNALGGIIAPHLLNHLLIDSDSKRRFNPDVLLLVLGVITTLALSGPSWRMEPAPFAAEEAALMVVMKIAPSMLGTDLLPSRLERSRHKLHDLLELRGDAASGLIAYAGSAHLVAPATTDGRVVEQLAAALEPAVMPREGDALDEALQLAERQLKLQKRDGSVVVITDSITPAQQEKLANNDYRLPVQILAAVASEETAVSTGVRQGAKLLDARLQLLTPDTTDIEAINSKAASAAVGVTNETRRWRDDGYLLVPLIVLLLLFWSLRGWSTEWQ
ncbi:MAG: VWA domain-containing protein [Pseudomonadota bacterium]